MWTTLATLIIAYEIFLAIYHPLHCIIDLSDIKDRLNHAIKRSRYDYRSGYIHPSLLYLRLYALVPLRPRPA